MDSFTRCAHFVPNWCTILLTNDPKPFTSVTSIKKSHNRTNFSKIDIPVFYFTAWGYRVFI
jgi:hypothetical protein